MDLHRLPHHPTSKSYQQPRSAYVAEHGEEDDEKADAPGDLETIEEQQDEEEEEEYASVEEAADDPSGEPEEADETDLELAAHCLTVTARRLNGLRLGRKFSGGKSLAQRKQESHCAVCGEKGHWKGDPECSMADKSQSDGAASNGQEAGHDGNTSQWHPKKLSFR